MVKRRKYFYYKIIIVKLKVNETLVTLAEEYEK